MPKYLITRTIEERVEVEWIEVEADDEDEALQAAYEADPDEWVQDVMDYLVTPQTEA